MGIYKQVGQKKPYDGRQAEILADMGCLVIFLPTHVVADAVDYALDGDIVISTWENNGHLVHARTNSHHMLCEKMPDHKFVGMGKWLK